MIGCIRDRVTSYYVGPAKFTNPLPFALTRRGDTDPGQYVLVLAAGSYIPGARYLAILNSTSPAELSQDGRPLLWVVPEVEMTPSQMPGSTLDELLAITYQSPPLRLTGGMRLDARAARGRALQAELLLKEDELLRVCCHCGSLENGNWVISDQFERSCAGGACSQDLIVAREPPMNAERASELYPELSRLCPPW
ncbi:hypothetical protein PUNSTDRAFT_139625 [Punctularia strigosozonata HHB-11173 SS5]|uniref:Uncharacterized protein n=1 Tax=Punctularia strigosozonata (strain HHB-11173) TaxID=741275 RepID=R7S0I2_PUNST|nr:uncharacterized protein PUNSTDRAFT_139625 [Punctularia strigosozonata HHB-11173 SS5]EIN03359.1 hypothetical protein PUNSTDRAFT_139625 [Punctularia strigosozonata HHB-11173 SS5]